MAASALTAAAWMTLVSSRCHPSLLRCNALIAASFAWPPGMKPLRDMTLKRWKPLNSRPSDSTNAVKESKKEENLRQQEFVEQRVYHERAEDYATAVGDDTGAAEGESLEQGGSGAVGDSAETVRERGSGKEDEGRKGLDADDFAVQTEDLYLPRPDIPPHGQSASKQWPELKDFLLEFTGGQEAAQAGAAQPPNTQSSRPRPAPRKHRSAAMDEEWAGLMHVLKDGLSGITEELQKPPVPAHTAGSRRSVAAPPARAPSSAAADSSSGDSSSADNVRSSRELLLHGRRGDSSQLLSHLKEDIGALMELVAGRGPRQDSGTSRPQSAASRGEGSRRSGSAQEEASPTHEGVDLEEEEQSDRERVLPSESEGENAAQQQRSPVVATMEAAHTKEAANPEPPSQQRKSWGQVHPRKSHGSPQVITIEPPPVEYEQYSSEDSDSSSFNRTSAAYPMYAEVLTWGTQTTKGFHEQQPMEPFQFEVEPSAWAAAESPPIHPGTSHGSTTAASATQPQPHTSTSGGKATAATRQQPLKAGAAALSQGWPSSYSYTYNTDRSSATEYSPPPFLATASARPSASTPSQHDESIRLEDIANDSFHSADVDTSRSSQMPYLQTLVAAHKVSSIGIDEGTIVLMVSPQEDQAKVKQLQQRVHELELALAERDTGHSVALDTATLQVKELEGQLRHAAAAAGWGQVFRQVRGLFGSATLLPALPPHMSTVSVPAPLVIAVRNNHFFLAKGAAAVRRTECGIAAAG